MSEDKYEREQTRK